MSYRVAMFFLLASSMGQRALAADNHPVARDIDRILGELEGIEDDLGRDEMRPQTLQNKTPKGKKNSKEDTRGIVINSETEASKATRELAEKLNAVQGKNRELRSRLLGLQDELVARMIDNANVDISIVGSEKESSDQKQYRILEVEGTLNDLPLLHYSHPVQLSKDIKMPIYKGPLPVGEYELKIVAMVGQMQHGWPYAAAQGKWEVAKTVKVKVTAQTPTQLSLVLTSTPTGPTLEAEAAKEKDDSK